MESFSSKQTSETWALWPVSMLRAPRCGTDLVVESLRRLFEAGREDSGAGGASLFLVLQSPIVWSADAERMREEGAWTAMLSTDALCPQSSSNGVIDEPSNFHVRKDLSMLDETI